MHQPDSDEPIKIVIDGEHVSGSVHYTGSSDITVRLECPCVGFVEGLHMPNFSRWVYPEGFLGKHGEERARELLEWLYREQKRGSARRRASAKTSVSGKIEEFGRVRYLAVNPWPPEAGPRHPRTGGNQQQNLGPTGA